MKTVILSHDGKSYRVSYDNQVEVFIPRGEPRVMQLYPRASYWRTLKADGRTATRVIIKANNIRRQKEQTL